MNYRPYTSLDSEILCVENSVTVQVTQDLQSHFCWEFLLFKRFTTAVDQKEFTFNKVNLAYFWKIQQHENISHVGSLLCDVCIETTLWHHLICIKVRCFYITLVILSKQPKDNWRIWLAEWQFIRFVVHRIAIWSILETGKYLQFSYVRPNYHLIDLRKTADYAQTQTESEVF